MNEISLHILDILQNSIRAGASLIIVIVHFDQASGRLSVSIEDNGCGMDEEYVLKVTDPFVTERTTRRVGLGIPLFKAGAEGCGGSFEIKSQKGKGHAYKRGLYDRQYRLSSPGQYDRHYGISGNKPSGYRFYL